MPCHFVIYKEITFALRDVLVYLVYNKETFVIKERCLLHRKRHFYWHRLTVIDAWICYHIHYFMCDMITHPWTKSKGGLTKLTLKLENGWRIITHCFVFCAYVIVDLCPKLDGKQVIYKSKEAFGVTYQQPFKLQGKDIGPVSHQLATTLSGLVSLKRHKMGT